MVKYSYEKLGGMDMIGYVIAFILLLAVGILCFFQPKLVWIIAESWKGNADEPSDVYVSLTKAVGIGMICTSVVCLLLILSMEFM